MQMFYSQRPEFQQCVRRQHSQKPGPACKGLPPGFARSVCSRLQVDWVQGLEQWQNGLRETTAEPSWGVTSSSGGHRRVNDPSTPQPARPINLTSTCGDTHCKAERKARCYQMSEASVWRMHWQGAVGSGALIRAKPDLNYLHNLLSPLLGQWTAFANSFTSLENCTSYQTVERVTALKLYEAPVSPCLTLNDRLRANLCCFGLLCGPAINRWLVPTLPSPWDSWGRL